MPYRSQFAPQLADLLRESGNIRAREAMDRGSAWGGAVQNIGQQVGGMLGQMAQDKRDAPRRAMEDEQARLGLESSRFNLEAAKGREGRAQASEVQQRQVQERAEKVKVVHDWLVETASASDSETQKAAYQAGRAQLVQSGIFTPEDAPEFFPGQSWIKSKLTKLLPEAEQYKQLFPETKAPEPFTLGPGQQRFGPDGQPVASVAPTPPAPRAPVSVAPGGRLIDPTTGKVVAEGAPQREPRTPEEPLVAIMGPDGQPVLVPRSQASGKRPASNREQGRPVVSGDANRIADLDTSLNDLQALETQLGTTGAASKAGAMLPNVVTEYTGWGADAKSRQGTIDRVKQVIGKALEGGVLRKEDEYKYTKILPTIGDPPEVAKSKLTGLRSAITQRRQTTLDALSDAGYETGKFNARTPAAAAPKADPLGIR